MTCEKIIPAKEKLCALVDAGFTIPEIRAQREAEKVIRIAAIKSVIGRRLDDYKAGLCLVHFDHLAAMPFSTITEGHHINATRRWAAVMGWI